MTDFEKREQDKIRLNNVIKSLERVNEETNKTVISIAGGMNEIQIIVSFNQVAKDLFNIMSRIVKETGREECKTDGYKFLFEQAIKINAKLPIDKFTLLILEYAAEIYRQDEDVFLNMTIPDAKVSVGNEFGIIRSEMFKKLWLTLDKRNKKILTDNVILLTTYAHAYLYKTILMSQK
uniref:Uncharacterized protein n=1 Tax=Moumouvirus sp. 'Monve' TaxID=1128131 RepID=H2EER1_9VIRU|nr:hypothetical protein mv_R679 [Moumouvirus Monve]